MKTETFTGPNKVLLVFGTRTVAHREDWPSEQFFSYSYHGEKKLHFDEMMMLAFF
jgi:hypothetical protein